MDNNYNIRYGVPAPLSTKGKYPVVNSNFVQGGFHVVDTVSDMLAIPHQFRSIGMEVSCLDTKHKYRLKSNPKEDVTVLTDWELVDFDLDEISENEILDIFGISNN